MKPGDSAEVGDYTVTYVRPTQAIDAKEQKLSFGAVLEVDRDGKRFATLYPARQYYSSTSADPTIAGFFEGEATSEVGKRNGVGGDLWTAMRPDLAPLDR